LPGEAVEPLRGRRLWFAGIGGAGLSAYAVLARAWGADVGGWDCSETPYLRHVRALGIPVRVSSEAPEPPEGAEVVVSTAYAETVVGKARAELLAELVSLRQTIVVTGAHGKTTTAAMIAFCLHRLGLDPAFLIGGEVPQLGGNAGTGSGWLVVEGDESDRSVFALSPEIAVVTNVDLDHHTTFASLAELEEAFAEWLARVPKVVLGAELEPVEFELAIPGGHNRRNAAAAIAALEVATGRGEEAAVALQDFTGAGRRFEQRGETGGVRVYDDYAHHPAEIEATLAAARGIVGDGRVIALFQPHLYSRTVYLATEFASALAAADVAVITEIYPAREAPWPGVSGKAVVDRLADARPGMRLGWAPRVDDAATLAASCARAGDVILTIGAGDVDSAADRILELLTR
jgi:UDP-N-acetylmuramate--alanine ligase